MPAAPVPKTETESTANRARGMPKVMATRSMANDPFKAWLRRTNRRPSAIARRLGRIVVAAVVVWGLAIAGVGLVGSLWPAAALLTLAGAADSISAVCRSTINQTVTPDALRGRMSSVFTVVVTGGPRLGDVEAGVVAALTSARFSVASGGLACVAGAGLVVLAFPALWTYE